MKINFILNETIHKHLAVDLPDDTDIAPADLRSLAEEEYDRIIRSGKELDGDAVDSEYFVRCDECADLVSPDAIHIIGDRAVCCNCTDFARRRNDLTKAGINLDAMIDMYLTVIREHNANHEDFHEKRNRDFAIMAFEFAFKNMKVEVSPIKMRGTGIYNGVVILGKSYLV